MKTFSMKAIIASLLILGAPVWADALDDSSTRTNQLTAKQSTSRVSTTLAGQYTTLAGSQENSTAIVGALRNGKSATIVGADGTTATVNSTGKNMGWGGVNNTLALAQSSLQKAGITNPTATQLAAAINSVTSARSSGMGWGEIAHSLGLNLGKVVSATKANEKALAQQLNSTKGDKSNLGKSGSHAKQGNHSGKGQAGQGQGGGNAGGNGGGNAGGNGGGKGGGNGGGK
ncbi:hypothetical protein [Chitinibacter sp. S2-10]|uniref:hypothetical protein n=1 Tax=Chitinibacter sp. S2-10 TaxID=3373597 RepID=UPI00397795DE